MKKVTLLLILVFSLSLTAFASDSASATLPIADDATVFVSHDGDLTVWMPTAFGDDSWSQVIYLSGDEIQSAAVEDDNMMLDSNADGTVAVYKLTNGQVAVNYLDSDGDFSQLVLHPDLSFASLLQFKLSEGIPYAS